MPLIVLTGLAEGAALLLALMIFTHQEQNWVLFALACLLILRLVSWYRYREKLAAAKTPKAALKILNGINRLYIVAGNFIPLLLILLGILFPAFIKPLGLVAALLALFSGWLMKFTIVTRAAKVQGYALGKLQKGRPKIKKPVRRDKDTFVFDREYKSLEQ